MLAVALLTSWSLVSSEGCNGVIKATKIYIDSEVFYRLEYLNLLHDWVSSQSHQHQSQPIKLLHCRSLVVYVWTLLGHFFIIKTLGQHSPSTVLALGKAYFDAFSPIVHTKRLKKLMKSETLRRCLKWNVLKTHCFYIWTSEDGEWRGKNIKNDVRTEESWKQKENNNISSVLFETKTDTIKKYLGVAKVLDFYNVLFRKSDSAVC